MSTRAIELLNKLLKLFNIDGTEYKNLIGDENALTLIDSTDAAGITAFTTGTSGNLASPDDTKDQNDCFIPMQSDGVIIVIKIGDYSWNYVSAGVGPSKTILGQSTGTGYGTLVLNTSGNNWYTFADNEYNGVKRIYFPKTINDDKTGGYVDFYYHKEAFKYAFEGDNSDVVITTEGAVYKGSITSDNLVVDQNGKVGIAGGTNQIILIKDIGTGAIGDTLEYTRRLALFLIEQMNLQTASADWLDWLGKTIFGIPRASGETDEEYADRIVDEIFSVKGSPVAIENLLQDYADDVTVTDVANSGAFADVSFSDYYKDLDYPPETVRSARTGGYGGLLFFFVVTLDNPDMTKANKIVDLIEKSRVGGTLYDILVI